MYKTEQEAKEAYHAMLMELYGDIDVCGMTMCAADVLEDQDPTAYRCGFLDWCDSEGIDLDDLE